MSKSVQAVRLTQRIRGGAHVPGRLEAMPMKPDFSHHDADWAPRSPPLEADARTEALRRPSRDSDPRPRGGRDRAEPIVVRLVRRFEWNTDSVFAAWVDPVIAGQWLFATAARPMVSAAIDSRAGGSFCLCEQRAEEIVEHSGTYVEFMPPRRLAFTLSTPDHPTATRIDVDIEPRSRGCVLRLLHANVHADRATRIRQRWIGILYGLDATLRGGVSGRAARTGPERGPME
jgi:uncharacterized protein YndB with AHSA1/START domain